MRRRIGQRYELGEAIGTGGTSTVHVGRLVGTAGFTKVIAIKRLHAHLAGDEALRAILIEEARLVSRISHPNVVAVLDVAEDRGEVFLVLEYARGATLSEVRRDGEPLPAPLAVAIMRDALAGLHAAHHARDAKGGALELVHRDVSPRNVIATTDGIGKVLDFGIAKARARASTTREGQVRGSLPYMAPEQIRDEALTARTDVYAASVVLWEAVTGKRLFDGESEAAIIQRILDHDVKAPSSVVASLPRALDDVILKGLAREPAERFGSGLEMATALEQALAPASSAEVAAFVRGLREEELAAREERLDASDGEREGAGEGEGAGERAGAGEGNGGEKGLATGQESTSSPFEVVTGKARPQRSRAGILVAGALFTVIVLVGFAALNGRSETSAAVSPPAPATAIALATAPATATATATATPTATAPATVSAPATASAPANAPPPTPAPASAPAPARTVVVGAAKSAEATQQACPPYYVDDAGVRRFNRECLK